MTEQYKATLSRSERYAQELERLHNKEKKLNERIRDLKRRMEEAQKVEAYEYMQAADLSPRQLKVLIEYASRNMPGDMIIDPDPGNDMEQTDGEEDVYGE